MATGFARGAAARGKRIAFGDGQKIVWHKFAEEMFKGNPNIAPPGSEGARDLEWIPHYAGRRVYNSLVQGEGKWRWVTGRCGVPGEMFFTDREKSWAKGAIQEWNGHRKRFVVIEPNVPQFKSVAPNKQWRTDWYEEVAAKLKRDGETVVQFTYLGRYGAGYKLASAKHFASPSFRLGLAVLSHAALYIGTEGGLHHGAAAVGIPAVVIFGGFISPDVTGYTDHINMFSGGEACGSLTPCQHCRDALDAIKSQEVYTAARSLLDDKDYKGCGYAPPRKAGRRSHGSDANGRLERIEQHGSEQGQP